MRKMSSRDIRSESRLDVLHSLLSLRQSTRNELARTTGLSLATVGTVTAELIAEGLVEEAGLSQGGSGRPTTHLQINRARGHLAGIDVAETYVSAHIFDASLNQVGVAQGPLDEHAGSADYLVGRVHDVLGAAAAEAQIDPATLLGVGIALPGLIKSSHGWTSLLSDRQDNGSSDLLEKIRHRLDLPLVVENPLKAIATAELWLGRGRTAPSMVTINLGTGVGMGIVLQGQVLRGFTNTAGEWGHSLLMHQGRRCRCGRAGCVEAYVGVPGIQATLREISPEHPLTGIAHQSTFIKAFAGALNGSETDAAVTATLEQTAQYLGSAIADVVAIINPALVMLTGWTAWALGEQLLPLVQAELVREAPKGAADDVELGISSVQGNSVAIGVATLAMERFLGDQGILTLRPRLTL